MNSVPSWQGHMNPMESAIRTVTCNKERKTTILYVMSYVKPQICPSVRPSYFLFLNISTQPTLRHDFELDSCIYYRTPLNLGHISLNILHLRPPIAWNDIDWFHMLGLKNKYVGDKDDMVEVKIITNDDKDFLTWRQSRRSFYEYFKSAEMSWIQVCWFVNE